MSVFINIGSYIMKPLMQSTNVCVCNNQKRKKEQKITKTNTFNQDSFLHALQAAGQPVGP